MCEAAAVEGECLELDVGTWDARACCVAAVLVVVCTEGVVLASCVCDFPDSGGHAGSLANQSSSSGPAIEAEGAPVKSLAVSRVLALSMSWLSLADLGIFSWLKA